ncbi:MULTISPECIES: restriction endonuclease subunit S [Heyndrickxia]|uniref:restriction endonuclease subunit S n=1 Tax=Heyndrickxia TaxID=2837504 RepID=UPI002DBEB3B0|nr:restriction endonuclease subunit S [Weizmannia sp. CD-2023]MEC2306292.1 restriction endonuclease subunit S [Weizmannia sp. CD-2023]MEC2342388.1 restriction endonuclease subunit S [Weizmannia sp. CD-2023]
MSEQTNLVPKRRFKEFQNTDAWEQRKLGDLLENAYQGINTAGDKVEYSESGVKILQSKHITSGNITFDDARYLDRDRYSEYLPKYVPNVDDILFANIGTIGPSAVVTEVKEFLIAWNILKMTPKKESNAKFIQLQLQRLNIKRYFESVTTGNATKFVNKDEMLRTQIIVPEKKEQSKIGEFFANLDNLITLHQRKLEKAKALKSAYLSEMFPAEGEREPKRRFAGFTQAWEQRKLGEIADIIGGGTPSTSNEEYWNGEIDWYSPVEIGEQAYVNSSQKKITELGLRKSSAKILPVGTVLFTSRAGIGNTAILAKEGATNQGFQSIVPHKDEIDSYFIYSRTHELKRYGETNGAGSTFVEVSGKQMAQMPIFIPTLEEQKKIGSFFERLDNLIALHQRKLEKLQNLKKAYLNEMFV